MKRFCLLFCMSVLAGGTLLAQNKVKGTYGYLYCHMSDRGEYTAYAVSRDGMNYQDIRGGEAIMNERAEKIEAATGYVFEK